MLSENLENIDLAFQGDVGPKTTNAFLKWIQQSGTTSQKAKLNGKSNVIKITSYDEFKATAIELFERLSQEYNYSGLVPIWHMRQELTDCLTRSEFNDWLMEMQGEQLFYLQTGEALGATDNQKQDSINSEIRGLLFYASLPE